jgi:PEP-CTERM motif
MLTHIKKKGASLLPLLAILALPLTAKAATLSAFDVATIQPAGPRTGSNGKIFLNVEGSGNGAFASFGAMDFDFPTPGTPIVGVQNASIDFVESNSAFSTDGPISIWYTANTAADIQPGSSVHYVSGNDGAASVDPTLGPLTLLGSGNYTNTSSGTVESFSLSFSGAALTGFISVYNSGSNMRLLVTPDAASTAATYAGLDNFSGPAPTLSFTPVTVPEPASAALALLGVVASLGIKSRRSQPLA